jgi:hypothetical protein
VLTLKTGKDIAVQTQLTNEDFSKGIPDTVVGKSATLFSFQDKGDNYVFNSSTFFQSQDGKPVFVPREMILMVFEPDEALVTALNKKWKKQSLFPITPEDVAKAQESKKELELKKGGR